MDSSINRLPPEVLTLIPYYSFNSYRDIIRATHVCRYWRDTFINYPLLWSSLDCRMHKDLVAAIVDRCGAVPLDVTLSPELNIGDSLLEKLVHCSAHIRKMCFPGHSLQHIVELSNEFNGPMQMLREVVIKETYGDSGTQKTLFKWPFLAGATNPVSLELIYNSWEPGTLLHFVIRFPTLTHLKIEFHDLRYPSTHELLELFRSMPQLEDIHIGATIVRGAAEECSSSPDQFRPVDLPRLHNIHLSWTTPQSQYSILACIEYPPTCSISLQTKVPEYSKLPPNPFPESWKAVFLPNLSFPVVTLRMERKMNSIECAVIVKKLNGASISFSHFECFPEPESDLDRADDRVFSAAISQIKELPLHSIEVFVLEGLGMDHLFETESFEIPPGLIKLICSDLPHLKTLTLTRTRVSELFGILTPTPPPPVNTADPLEERGTSESNIPCRTLKVLEVRHPDWEPNLHFPEALALAEARKSKGVPFEMVLFRSFDAPESIAKKMSSYVNDVDIEYCPCKYCVGKGRIRSRYGE